jgi:hypothetical protein
MGEEDHESVEESNEPPQHVPPRFSGRPPDSKNQGSVQVIVELPQHPGTP